MTRSPTVSPATETTTPPRTVGPAAPRPSPLGQTSPASPWRHNRAYRRASLSPARFPSICTCQVDGAGFGYQRGRLVDGRIGRMGEHITSQEPLHHTADTRSHLEDAQGLLRGGSWQSRDQALPDLPIQRPVVYALLGSEITN